MRCLLVSSRSKPQRNSARGSASGCPKCSKSARMLRESAALLAASLCFAQVLTTGPQVTTFLSDVDDSDQPYALYIPRDLDPHKKYPLVISLHDADSNHRINLRQVFGAGNRLGESDAQATHYFPKFKD